jgi:hypothetical protein
VRSGGAGEVQSIRESEQDILESLGQQAEVFDIRCCGIEVGKISRLRPIKVVHMLEREQLVQAYQALLQTAGEHRGAVDLSRFCAAPSARLGHFPFKSDGAFPA